MAAAAQPRAGSAAGAKAPLKFAYANGLDKERRGLKWGGVACWLAKFTTPFIKSMHKRYDRPTAQGTRLNAGEGKGVRKGVECGEGGGAVHTAAC